MGLETKKVAIVHDWLLSRGGAERVLYDLHCLFPDAPIYVLFYDADKAPDWCAECDIRTSSFQIIPNICNYHKLLLRYMPKAWEELNLMEYDLIVSSCSCCCKGIISRPDAVHICYCHSPIRYIWDLYYDYLHDAGSIKRYFMKRWIPQVRQWDFLAAQRVDYFISNSDFVGKRIKKYYRRDSTTIYPSTPIRLSEIQKPQGYYLVVSRLVRYKRIDIAIDACNKLGRLLYVIGGDGEEKENLRKLAGQTVRFLDDISDEELKRYYAGADAFLFPGKEDFGLTPVEAMSCGVPVIAFGEGGALESVVDGVTGLFFKQQNSEDLIDAILRFERSGVGLSREEISKYAMRYSTERFRKEFYGFCCNHI